MVDCFALATLFPEVQTCYICCFPSRAVLKGCLSAQDLLTKIFGLSRNWKYLEVLTNGSRAHVQVALAPVRPVICSVGRKQCDQTSCLGREVDRKMCLFKLQGAWCVVKVEE